jgi:hypothetical protein
MYSATLIRQGKEVFVDLFAFRVGHQGGVRRVFLER